MTIQGLYSAQDYAVALGPERIKARGYTPEQLARECGDSAYTSPTVLGLLWTYADRLDLQIGTLALTIAGTRYMALPKPDGGYETFRTALGDSQGHPDRDDA